MEINKNSEEIGINHKLLSKLFFGKQYKEVINMVEDYLSSGIINSELYTLMGICQIYLLNYELAKISLEKAIELDKVNIEAMNALAFVLLKSEKDIQASLELYLRILEIDKDNKLAKRNLNLFKKEKNTEKILRNLHPDDFIVIKKGNINKILTISFIALVVVIVIIIVLAVTQKAETKENDENNNINRIIIEKNIKN